jgi:hypothetical protein
MRKRVQIALVLLLVTIVSIIAWQVLREREPLYQGRTMGSWLNSPDITDNELARQVWEGFGSNAVPFLRKALEARDGPTKKAYWAVRRNLPNWIKRYLPRFDPLPSAILRGRAADGLAYIGEAATPAIPDLIRLSKNDQDGDFSKGFVRGRAVAALGNIGRNMEPANPPYRAVTEALIEALNDPDPEVRSFAAHSLKLQFPEAAARAGVK